MAEIKTSYGKWQLLSPVEGSKPPKWNVRCACGTTGQRDLSKMVSGQSRSCGCTKHAAHSRIVGESLQKRGA